MAVKVEKSSLVNPRLFKKLKSYLVPYIGNGHFEKMCNETEFLNNCNNLSDNKVVAVITEDKAFIIILILENKTELFRAAFDRKELV